MFKNKCKYRVLRLRPADSLGFPDSVENGIMYYKTRSQLPLKELLPKIDKQMCMLALSFTLLITENIGDIRDYLAKGKRMMFLILNPERHIH